MKILVAIANFGLKNDGYLLRLLAEYRSMPYQIDLVVVSNVHKELGKDVEVVTGLPTKNPHSLPFAHKGVFADRKDAYDLFIYTEDDILIAQRNIEAFLRVSNILPQHELAGFFRREHYPDGRRSYPDAHYFYRWVPDSVKAIADHTFARFTNVHSGCYALTRDQLAQAMASGGFLVPPHEHKYGLLETAATDPYIQCGFTKVICLSHLEDFIIQHLPNRYIGSQQSLDEVEFNKQLEALLDARRSHETNEQLLEPETKVFHCGWSKNHYEPCRSDLIGMFPNGIRNVLSIGCGWGETEAELARKGIDVTAIALDSVIGACAESRGVKVVYGCLDSATDQLRDRQFEGVLLSSVIHLMKEPDKAMCKASSLLAEGGVLVTTVPAFYRLPFLWSWLRNPSRYQGWRDFQVSGVHPIGRSKISNLFRNAGLSLERTSWRVPKRWKTLVALSCGLAEPFFSSENTFVGRKQRHIRPFTQREIEPEMTCVGERSSSR